MPTPLYGSTTEQAVRNFPISGWQMPREFLHALAMIKEHAARVHGDLGVLPKGMAKKIATAARTVKQGKHDDQFPVDVFQTGSGTSSNMNVNEVIARLASEKQKESVHPNDHVNHGQSSNDVVPTAMHVSCALMVRDQLVPALSTLVIALEQKADAFDDIIKTGRTHLMDAVPVRLGDEFRAFGTLIMEAMDECEAVVERLCAVPLGGTAVGTGLNAHPQYARKVIALMRTETNLPLEVCEDRMASQSCPIVIQALSGVLQQVGCALTKIANDVRLMASGPVAGFQEIRLPTLQPGSSIMPGKVNPVLCESVIQVACWIDGAHTTVHSCLKQGSHFQLNTALPLATSTLITGMKLLSNVSNIFAKKCIKGIKPNRSLIEERTARNAMLVTALAPHIGYDHAAEIAKESMQSGETIIDVAQRKTGMSRRKLERMLDAEKMA